MTSAEMQEDSTYPQHQAEDSSRSYYRDWRDVGKIKGRLEQEREILRRFLTIRFGELPPAYLARVAEATMEECNRWGLRLFHARTLAGVFPESEQEGRCDSRPAT